MFQTTFGASEGRLKYLFSKPVVPRAAGILQPTPHPLAVYRKEYI
ncbi:LysR family transcriptional regulator [Neisseria sicca]|nr:LysR family transcriptional regulator [Neisseria sicca]